MKHSTLGTCIAFAFVAGCAMQTENRVAGGVSPVMDVRHGMADGMAYFQLGRHYQGQGLAAQATDAFEKALVADPRHAETLNALGALYAERGNALKSTEMFRRLAEVTPARAYLYNNIGYALHLQGRYGEAVDALRTAVTLDPAYARAWVNLEQAARSDGKPELAAQAMRRNLSAVAVASAPAGSGDGTGTLVVATVATTPAFAQPIASAASSVAEAKRAAATPAPIRLTEIEPVPYTAPSATVVSAAPIATQPAAGPIVEKIAVSPAPTLLPVPAATVQETTPQTTSMVQSVDARDLALQAIAATVAPVVSAPSARSGDVREHALRVAAAAGGRHYDDARDRLLTALQRLSDVPVESTMATGAPVRRQISARFEVSNGNGISRYANRVSEQMRREGLPVVAITNHSSFAVQRTEIEYLRGHAESARELGLRLGVVAELKEKTPTYAGANVRLVLGRDTGPQFGSLIRPASRPARVANAASDTASGTAMAASAVPDAGG